MAWKLIWSSQELGGDPSIGALSTGQVLKWNGSNWINVALAATEVSGFDTQVRTNRLDQMAAPTADVSLNSQKITNLGTPSGSTDAATKGYVDGVAQGLDAKGSVRVATTAAGTLASDFENGDTVDGVVLATGNRILIKNQSTATENGIYTVNASGAPTRASDMAAASSAAGAFVFVEEGTTNADSGWVCTSDVGADTVGTHNLSFTQFSGAGQVTAGDGLTKSGNTLNVGAGTGITVNADDVQIANGGVGTTQLANNGVDNTKLADMAANTIKANATAGSTDPADLSVGTNTVVGRVAGNIVAAQLATGQVANDAIDNTKLANMAANTVKVNNTGGSADPTDLTVGTNTVLGRVGGNIVAATIVDAQVNDVATTKLTGNMPDARIVASNVTQHVASIDHNALQNYDAARHRKINAGLASARGTAAAFGVGYYFATDTGVWSYSDGSTWVDVTATPSAHATSHKNGGTDQIRLHEFGDPSSAVAFAGQQGTNFVIHTVADITARDALTAVNGKLARVTSTNAIYVYYA